MKNEMQSQARTELKKLLHKGKYQVYTQLNHVSRSGMNRAISAYTVIDNKPVRLDWYIEQLGNFKGSKNHQGLSVGGCGMDMGFYLVYKTSCALYCPNKYDHNKAYKLKHIWL